jgi:hypothetical protein
MQADVVCGTYALRDLLATMQSARMPAATADGESADGGVMIRSDVDRRAKRYAAKQCVADHGMHKDAPARKAKIRKPTALRPELDRRLRTDEPRLPGKVAGKRKDGLAGQC